MRVIFKTTCSASRCFVSFVLLGLCLAALPCCGGRSSPRAPWIDGHVRTDSDSSTYFDNLVPDDSSRRDACLPIPASQVRGIYSGTWKGTWTCPGQKSQQVSGNLDFSLKPASSPNAFTVNGSMDGVVVGMAPFTSSISGTMGCTALSASLPDIKVGSGALMILLTGSMKGTFTYVSGSKAFQNGTWTAQEKGGNCKASGNWSAANSAK